MTQLSDTQALILSAAAQRPERIALPLPESLRGGAAAKVVGAMLAKGFLQEVDADLRKGEPMWRETGDGHGTTLVATDAGLGADVLRGDRCVHREGSQAVGLRLRSPQDVASGGLGPKRKRLGPRRRAMIGALPAPVPTSERVAPTFEDVGTDLYRFTPMT